MNAANGPSVRTPRGPGALAGGAIDLALALTLSLPRPFAHTMGHRGLARMAAAITLPCGGRAQGAAWGHVVGQARVAGLPMRVGTDPQARRARGARDEADAGRPLLGRGARPLALMGAPAWWSGGGALRGAGFPRRSGPAPPPQGGGGRRVPRGLAALPQGRERRARQSQLAGQAGRRLALSDPRNSSTRVAGRCRVFAKTVPVSSVS
jgi:hypothetical protein